MQDKGATATDDGRVKLATLWIGGNISWLEQLCIKSFLDHGHEFTLFTYEGVTNAPNGTIIADANAMFPKDEFIIHRNSGSSALHSDIFRYHMIARTGLVWVDADMLCMRPWTFASDFIFGWEKRKRLICGAALGFPKDSQALKALIEFCDDPAPIPAWYSPEARAVLEAARDAGKPVEVADLPWGIWGPAALTHILKETGEVSHTLPENAFYPISFKDRRDMLSAKEDITERLGGESCYGVHLWNRRLRRRLVTSHDGVPPAQSFLGQAVTRHNIDCAAAPIPDVPPASVLAERAAAAAAAEATQAKGRTSVVVPAMPAPPPPDKTIEIPRRLKRDAEDPCSDATQPGPPAAMASMTVQPMLHAHPKFKRMSESLERVLTVRGPWLAPPKKEPGREQILIVTAMKNEAPFVLEWIAYNQAIGVDHVLVYTNHCTDNTDAILDRLSELGHVTRLDNPYETGSNIKPQHAALKDAVKQKVYKDADWIITIDLDEFIAVHVGDGTLQDLFRASNYPNAVSLTWKFFGNGGVIDYEDKPIIEQFDRCAPEVMPDAGLAWGFKTFFNRKAAKFRRLGVHRPGGMVEGREGDVRWINGSGRVMPRRMIEKGWRTTQATIGYRLATLNHYALRSADSYLVKRDRGRINHTDQDQGVYYWQRRNYITEEDKRIQVMLPRVKERLAGLMADPRLAMLHAEAVAWHKRRIGELQADADYARVYGELVRTAKEDATFFAKLDPTDALKSAETPPAPVAHGEGPKADAKPVRKRKKG